MQATSPTVPAGFVSELFAGVGYLGRGFGMWVTSPRLMLLGAIPALIVGTIYLAAIIFLVVNLDPVATWMTPFANDWDETARTVIRVAATLAIVVVAVLLAAYTFAAVTLVVGDPFYERIWRAVETRLGDAPADLNLGVWRSMLKAIGDGIRLLIPAIGVGILVFFCGLIPLVGTPIALTLGAVFGGWLLVVELTGFAFDARGFSVKNRRRALKVRRARSLGFGMATYLLFLVPVAAVVVMPSAVAGAAMLSRDTLAASGDTAARPAK
ncbi:CysZ protein [Glaciihabitans tibetensis]|uniref:CysZ protein n=1 Tax=Glaciihabitans tibetensis TaxID=1266600 RepID=A0A2T0VDS0_9MICO|nr:EI24 domain-containing protein [Glaciihabitans tibetensis]PRY68321.1 CysZ protein [Glaciihabitans tibetensis]